MRSISLRAIHLHLGQFIGKTIVEKPITQICLRHSSEVTIVNLLVRKTLSGVAHRKHSGKWGLTRDINEGIAFKWTVELPIRGRRRERARTAAIAQIDSSVANKNSITLRLLSKSLGGPFSGGPPRHRLPRFFYFFFFFICSPTLTGKNARRCYRGTANWLLTLVTRFLSLSVFLSLILWGQPVHLSDPPPLHPAFAVKHRVLHIYILAHSFTQLCFCVQINLRCVKNGKRQSFGVDSDCFITFQDSMLDMSSSLDKESNRTLETFSRR